MEISDRTSLGNYDHDHDHHHTGAVAFPMCLSVDQMDDDDQRVEATSTTDDQHDQAGGVSDHLVNYQASADVSTEAAEIGLFFPTARSHDDVDFPNMEKYFDDQHSFYLGAACSSLIIREADACLQQIDHHTLINTEKDDDDDHHDQYSFDNISSFEQCQKIRNSSVMIFRRRSCDQSAARLQSRSSDRDASRSCVVCHTTKTPLWRGGPKGPKSLCNACGIRQRKARRAALMATAASGDQVEAVSLSDDHSTTNIIINAGMITKKKVGRKRHDHHHHHHHGRHEFDHEDMNMNSSAAVQLDQMLMVRRPRKKLLHIQKKKKKTTKETSSSAAANLIQMTNYSDDQFLFETCRSITGRINTANPKDLLHQAAGFNDLKAGTAGTGQLVINFSGSSTSTNRRSAFSRVFPKDEEEGAVLLMALSCKGGRSDYS